MTKKDLRSKFEIKDEKTTDGSEGKVIFSRIEELRTKKNIIETRYASSQESKISVISDKISQDALDSVTLERSIASSFETPLSNVDTHESSSLLWNRKASGNTGSVYSLPRVVSTGNAESEIISTVYYNDTNNGLPTWRGTRSSSFDHTRPPSSSLNNNQDEELHRSSSLQSALDEQVGRPRSSSV